MNARLAKLVATLAITAILLGLIRVFVPTALSNSAGGQIDVFTQREPYNGKGLNVSSDAFGPGEDVQVFALVTYNEYPVGGVLVAFNILGPRNQIETITINRVAQTNETGIAVVSFRISTLNDTTFGLWTIDGSVKIGDSLFQDLMTFKVGWIVNIISLKTINERHIDQEKFPRGGYVGIEIGLRNIAMIEKTATLTVTISDCLNIAVNSDMRDLVLQPNETTEFYFLMQLSKNAHIGLATIYANAYTDPPSLSGTPYCPEFSGDFSIVSRDIAISKVQPFPSIVYMGESVYIDVSVENRGSEAESFNVSIKYNETLINIETVSDLQPLSNTTLGFIWNTSAVMKGLYLISAAALVPDDENPENNLFIDGYVEVKAIPPPKVHLLKIISDPISDVTFSINSTETRTPYIAISPEAAYIITFPLEWIDPATALRYGFSRWEDGSTSPTRVIILVLNMTLTAHYERLEYELTISATGGGTTNPPPGSYKYSKGTSVAITATPSSGYKLDRWTLDGVDRTGSQIIVLMNMDHALVAYFKVIPTHTLSVASSPVDSVSFTINGKGRTTPYSETLEEDNYTIIMPASFADVGSGKTYSFDRWENGLTSTSRTVLLDKDMNLTAYYKEAIAGVFVPDVFWWFLLGFLLLLLFILLIAWYYRRRRRKEDTQAFHSGWTAWYYCYNIPKKPY